MDPKRAEARGHLDPVLGLPVLRVVRLRRHLVGGDCRRAAGVLLPDRAVGRRDAVRRSHRQATGHRLVDGDDRVGARRVPVARRSTCRPARPSSAPSGWRWRSWRPSGRSFNRVEWLTDDALSSVRNRNRRQGAHLLPLRDGDDRGEVQGRDVRRRAYAGTPLARRWCYAVRSVLGAARVIRADSSHVPAEPRD